jgi:hypothetical protein
MTSQGDSPRAPFPSRFAPDAVVTTTPGRWEQCPTGGIEVVVVVIVAQQDGVDRRSSAAAIVGPVSFREAVPQPKAYLRPGRRTSGRSAGASRRLRSARWARQRV